MRFALAALSSILVLASAHQVRAEIMIVSGITRQHSDPSRGNFELNNLELSPNVTYELSVETGEITLGFWHLASELEYEFDGAQSSMPIEVFVRESGRAVWGYGPEQAYRISMVASLENKIARFRYSVRDDTVCIPDATTCNHSLRTPMRFLSTFWQVKDTEGGAVYLSYGAPTPEPGTWLLLIGGFGMVGAGLRRRPRAAKAYQ